MLPIWQWWSAHSSLVKRRPVTLRALVSAGQLVLVEDGVEVACASQHEHVLREHPRYLAGVEPSDVIEVLTRRVDALVDGVALPKQPLGEVVLLESNIVLV